MQPLPDNWKAAPLKPITPCPLEIHYLYHPRATIRFDKVALERVHISVYSPDMKTFHFSYVFETEEAKQIYRELRLIGAIAERKNVPALNLPKPRPKQSSR